MSKTIVALVTITILFVCQIFIVLWLNTNTYTNFRVQKGCANSETHWDVMTSQVALFQEELAYVTPICAILQIQASFHLLDLEFGFSAIVQNVY